MRRPLALITLLLALLCVAVPLLAQQPSAATPATSGNGSDTVSFFKAFFWPDGSIIGLVIVWGLVIASTASIGYAIMLFLSYRRVAVLPPDVADTLEQLIADKKYREAIETAREHPSYLAVLTSAALEEAPNGYGAMERAIEEAADVEVSRMMRPIELLNVLGNIAPMVGLFGTVYGMIVAFQQLVAAGGKPDAASLAGGISTALVTTFWGLVVAIPALAAYALIRNRIDALTSEGVVMVESLISTFKPSGKRKKEKDRSGRPRATPQPKTDEPESLRDEEPS